MQKLNILSNRKYKKLDYMSECMVKYGYFKHFLTYLVLLLLLLQSALQHLVGFWPAQLSLSILSRKVLQSAVASGTSNPQLGGDYIFSYFIY
jgi:hypothetical protein